MRWPLTIALLLAFAAAPMLWAWWRMRRWGLNVRVGVDPADPRPDAIAGYFAEIARRLDEHPERMRIVVDGRNERNLAIALDLLPDRRMRVQVEGRRPKLFNLRSRWIADHPVPLDLRHAVCYVEPVDANRFRVMSAPPFGLPVWLYVLCSLVATVGLVLFIPELVAVAAGIPLGTVGALHLKGI